MEQGGGGQTGDDRRLHLHYSAPASEWAQALPLGNGRLGCMVHGRTTTELMQLNEDTVWYGGPQDRTPRDALRNLPRLRQLIRSGSHAEAEALVRSAFFATPASMRHCEPLGNAYFEFDHGTGATLTDYSRWLDLETALHTVSYRHGGGDIWHRRQTLVSYPDSVIATRIESSQPFAFTIRLNRFSEVEYETNEFLDSIHASDGRIVLHATPGGRNSNRLCIVLGVQCSGDDKNCSIEAIGNSLVVRSSSSCVVAIGAQTTYRHADPEQAARRDVDVALRRPWDELRQRHIDDYQRLFGRTRLCLGKADNGSHVPTDERIKRLRDPGLVALYHNYGRYLLISSSRRPAAAGEPETRIKALPATLQGLWNPSFAPPWGCKYTININIQMNYWPAAPCQLVEECVEPLVELLERMAVRGRITAETMYGCAGWCAHHNTDIWADTDPQDRWMPSTLWPLGGVWLCVDILEMLQYKYDRELHQRVAPLLQGCVEFLLDFLIVSECGKYLVTNPSLSPENTFVSNDGTLGILCEGSTIDNTIIRIAFERYLWSERTLGHAPSTLSDKVVQALDAHKSPHLPEAPAVNKDGLIQEWGNIRDYAEHEPGHRHVSHLFGLYPGDSIHPDTTPDLCAAARRVLDRRAAHGGGHTGWSRAWLLNLHARLRDADACAKDMDLLLRVSTLPNLLDNHPPFQIDGNFGGCAGILECLVQSRLATSGEEAYTVVHILPACPGAWSTGELEGVVVRGGWMVTFSWDDGKLKSPIKIQSIQDEPLRAEFVLPSGQKGEVSTAGNHEMKVE